jgi:thiamine kinase-like enzyme
MVRPVYGHAGACQPTERVTRNRTFSPHARVVRNRSRLTGNEHPHYRRAVISDPDVARAFDAVPAWRGLEPEITPIAAGRTNRNFRVELGGEAFFLRISGKDTELLGIDRAAEHRAALGAAAAGVGPEVVAFLPELGCLITRWVPGTPLAEGDLEDEDVLARVVEVVRTIHAGPGLPSTFDAFAIVQEYRRVSIERGVRVPDAYERAFAAAERIRAAFARRPSPRTPCHNDLLADNFLRGADGMWLVDYEYAGMGDAYFDLGNLSINNGLSDEAQERLLQLYVGEVTDAHRARLRLMRIMSDYREAMWGVVQQGLSTLDIDYVAYAQVHFERLERTMADDRFDRWLDQAGGAPT